MSDKPQQRRGLGRGLGSLIPTAPEERPRTAMDEADMQALLAWLDPQRQPRFVLLPQAQYRRLAGAWGLPLLLPAADTAAEPAP